MTITKSNHMEIKDISLSKPKPYSNNKGYCVNLYYDKSGLHFQTPRLLCLFGLNIYKHEKTGNIQSINISLQFNSSADKINRVDNFLKKIKTLDNLVKHTAKINHKSWLNYSKKIPSDAIEALYKKSLYYKIQPTGDIDHSIPPTFKIKLPYYNGQFKDLTVLDPNNTPIDYDLEYLQSKIIDKCIIKCIINPSIYIIDSKFGITYTVKALQIYDKMAPIKQPKPDISNYFQEKKNLSSSDDESEDEEVDIFN